jgi:hypothetical protein
MKLAKRKLITWFLESRLAGTDVAGQSQEENARSESEDR